MLGVALHIGIERGAHHEVTVGHRFREGVDELFHLVEGVVEVIIRRILGGAIDRRRRITPRAIDLTFGHESVLHQIIEHDIGAGARGRQIDQRRKFGRRLEHAGEHRRFRQRDVAHRFAEIILGRGVDAEGSAAQIGAVEIEFQDLVLRQMRFEPQRQEGFVDLARQGAFIGEEQVLGELLGQRRSALHHAAGLGIGHQGAEGALEIDAKMLVEVPVLGGQHRLDQVIGKFVERHRFIVLDAAVADLVAVTVEEGDGEIRLLQPIVVGGLAEGRHRQRDHEHEGA